MHSRRRRPAAGWNAPAPPPPGPRRQVTGEGYTRHAFDGDGMVCCFGFKDGRAWFKNKFVRTKGFVEEQVGALSNANLNMNRQGSVSPGRSASEGLWSTRATPAPRTPAAAESVCRQLCRCSPHAPHTHASLQAAGRPLYRSAFTTGSADGSPFFNPFDLDMKNVANTGGCLRRLGCLGRLGCTWVALLHLGTSLCVRVPRTNVTSGSTNT